MFIPINFGDRVAENEAENLNSYFVETHAWKELYEGKKDVVFGSKGAGKSALYTLLLQKESELLSSRNTFLLSAEKPQGQTVFSDISSTPPTSEKEFVYLWKIYFCQLIVDYLQKNNQCKGKANEVRDRLVEAGLIQETNNLKRLLNGAASFAKKLANIESLEGGGSLVEASVSGRITFRTPSFEESQKGLLSVDELLVHLDEHLRSISMSCWLLCDRLDVAFDESLELEKNALRALFKVYRDVEEYQQIALKVFLRDDIWARITKEGFREASHITRTTTISWDSKNLLNLIIRRALCDTNLVKHFNVNTSEIMNDHNQQEKFYYEIFPKQVDLGEKKSETFEWIKSRIRDGLMNTPPRELIHYYNEIVTQEQREQEIGNDKVEEPNIVSRAAIKNATIEVSK
ncbi:P-loop ATPase, Sll1717 family, partial [Vibrio parahaemolyticus]